MNVAAFVVSVIAVLISLSAAWFAWQQAKAAEEQNRISGEQLALAKAEAEKYRIPWRFEWRYQRVFALVNDSDDPEYNVQIAQPEHGSVSLRTDGTVLGPKESLIFVATLPAGRQLSVTWRHQPDGEELTWREWLPARPKNS